MKKILLLGHGVGIKRIIDTIREKRDLNAEVVGIVTHPLDRHKRELDMISRRKDMYGDCYYNVFEATKDYNIPLLESENVNNQESINWINAKCPDYIISVGCRDILRKPFLDLYPNKVFNIHTTPLPRYRGAATDTWMILNGEEGKELYGCFHEVDTGIDTGRILAKENYSFPPKSYPIDVFKARMSIFSELFSKAVRLLNDGNCVFEVQNKNDATTFPRLYTPKDGRIDFKNMDGQEIQRMVYGFGYPFEGAHCFLNDERINLFDVEFIASEGFHLFSFGLIFGKNEQDQYKIYVKGGFILVKKIEVNGKPVPQKIIFRVGKRLQ